MLVPPCMSNLWHFSTDRRSAWLLLGVTALTWSAFSWRLYTDGVAARAVLLPIDPASYHAAQAVFVGPLLVLLATVFARVAYVLARRAGGVGSWGETWGALVSTYAGVLLLCFVAPDALIYLLAGREAMARAMRYYAPWMPVLLAVSATVRLRGLHGIGAGRASLCVLAGLLVQLALGAPLLR